MFILSKTLRFIRLTDAPVSIKASTGNDPIDITILINGIYLFKLPVLASFFSLLFISCFEDP